MPLVRCLDCSVMVERRQLVRGRCRVCGRARKAARNAAAAQVPPRPPLDATCWLCGRGRLVGDPMTWDHVTPMADRGRSVRPAHKSCNAGRRNRAGYVSP